MTEYLKVEESALLCKTHRVAYKEEAVEVIDICTRIHHILGNGFKKIVYKDAMEYEFNCKKKLFIRERKFEIEYDGIILLHPYSADFVYENAIIIDVKAQHHIVDNHFKQTISRIASSKIKLGLIINFGEDSLKFQRVVL